LPVKLYFEIQKALLLNTISHLKAKGMLHLPSTFPHQPQVLSQIQMKHLLSEEYSNLFIKGITIGYQKRLDEITSIGGKGSGLIKAIIHFFITHSKQHIHRISFDQLLETIGYPQSDRMKRSAITTINKHRDNLQRFSISYYPKDRIFEYSGTFDIDVIPPLPEIIK
jgi:hypothetical protein